MSPDAVPRTKPSSGFTEDLRESTTGVPTAFTGARTFVIVGPAEFVTVGTAELETVETTERAVSGTPCSGRSASVPGHAAALAGWENKVERTTTKRKPPHRPARIVRARRERRKALRRRCGAGIPIWGS
jgi:hypothetical protein